MDIEEPTYKLVGDVFHAIMCRTLLLGTFFFTLFLIVVTMGDDFLPIGILDDPLFYYSALAVGSYGPSLFFVIRHLMTKGFGQYKLVVVKKIDAQ